MHKQYLTKMDDTFDAIDGFVTKMSRQIRDLDDVRFAMEALKDSVWNLRAGPDEFSARVGPARENFKT